MIKATTGDHARLGWRWAILLFAVVAIVQGLSTDVQVTDSRLTVPTAYAVIHDHTLALNKVPSVPAALKQTGYDVVRRHGEILPLYPWTPMLLAIPATAIAEVAGVNVATLRPSSPNRTFPIEIATAAALVAVASVVMALVALELVGSSPRARRFALAVALIFAFGTSAWSTASRALWQHTPALTLSSVVLLAALRSKRDARYLWLLGAALALGYTMRPTMIVPLIIVGLWSVLTHRRDALRMVVAGLVVGLGFVAVNLHYYHSLLTPYYTGSGNGLAEGYGFFDSLGVQLVSPSRGLLVYTPMFLLVGVGVWIKCRQGSLTRLDVALAGTCLAYVVVITASGSTGGTSYGNRMFTDVVPYFVYFCIPVFERLLLTRDLRPPAAAGTVLLVGVSVLMSATGAVSHAALCWSATPVAINNSPSRVWSWSDPQFLRPVKDLSDGVSPRNVLVGSCSSSATK